MSVEHFRLLAGFNAWANERIYDSVALLTDEAYRSPRGAFFGSIHNTLNHLLVVDRLWTGRIAGIDRDIRALDQILHENFDALRAARRLEDSRLVDLAEGLDPEALERLVRYQRIIGDGDEEARVGHILATLFNHQTHHRGQVHVLLTQADVVPPPLDVIYFLDEIGESGSPGRPQAASPR